MNDEEFRRSIEGSIAQAARVGRDSGGTADQAAHESAALEEQEAAASEERRARSAYGQAAAAQAQRTVVDGGAQEARPMVRAGNGLGKATPFDVGTKRAVDEAPAGAVADGVAATAAAPEATTRAAAAAPEEIKGPEAPAPAPAINIAPAAPLTAPTTTQTAVLTATGAPPATPATSDDPTQPFTAPPLAAPGAPRRRALQWSGAAAVAVAAGLAAWFIWPHSQPGGSVEVGPAGMDPVAALRSEAPSAGLPDVRSPEAEAAATSDWPTLGVVAETGDGTPSRLAGDLERLVGPGARLNVEPVGTAGWAESLEALRVQPRVTVARYDLLQAVRRVPDAAPVPPLEIVAPLATEPVYFVVRADSPLRFIHQIADTVINIGPQSSARALTAATVYRDMFGRAVPAGSLSRLDENAALDELVGGTSIDVVVVVGASPESALGRLGRDAAGRLRLLTLDPADAASRRVVRSFLPAEVAAGALGSFPQQAATTLSVMSFLVTSPAAGDGAATHDQAIASLARSLCVAMPTLQQGSGSAWRGVQPGVQLDVGWPWSAAARKAFDDCTPESDAPPRPAGR